MNLSEAWLYPMTDAAADLLVQARPILEILKSYTVVGSIRRGSRNPRDIDVVCYERGVPTIERLRDAGFVVEHGQYDTENLIFIGPPEMDGEPWNEWPRRVDVRFVRADSKGTPLVFLTGPRSFNQWLDLALPGWRLMKFESEEKLFEAAGVNPPWIPPDHRGEWASDRLLERGISVPDPDQMGMRSPTPWPGATLRK